MLDSNQLQEAWLSLARVNGLYNRTRFSYGDHWFAENKEGQFMACKSALESLGPTGLRGIGLQSGLLAPERWAAILQLQVDFLNQIERELNTDPTTIDRFWTEVVVKSGSDVVVAAAELKDSATPYIAVIVVILALILAIKVT